MQNNNILLFVHSLSLPSLIKALQLSKVGLSTIKHQHSKNLTRWTEATWTKNTLKMQIVCKSLFTKSAQMRTKGDSILTVHVVDKAVHLGVDDVIFVVARRTCRWRHQDGGRRLRGVLDVVLRRCHDDAAVAERDAVNHTVSRLRTCTTATHTTPPCSAARHRKNPENPRKS